jgi:hypothetical protein
VSYERPISVCRQPNLVAYRSVMWKARCYDAREQSKSAPWLEAKETDVHRTGATLTGK